MDCVRDLPLTLYRLIKDIRAMATAPPRQV
jgi:hypothetical protein